MIEDIKEFYANNSTMIMIAIAIRVVIISFMMYRRMNSSSSFETGSSPTQFNKLSDMTCDMESGLCHPPDTLPQLSQGQDQETRLEQD